MTTSIQTHYYTKRDLTTLLNVSSRTITRMVHRGHLPEPMRISSRCLRWNKADVDAALARLMPAGMAQ